MSLPEPFSYPIQPHLRKHSPAGYANYTEYKPWLRDKFDFRCVYCLQRETWSRAGAASFSVDHIIPQAFDPDCLFTCDYTNLLYACLWCNSLRQDEMILNPTGEGMGEHLCVHPDGTIAGITFDGLVLVKLLHLNRPSAIRERQRILRILHRRVRYPNDPEVLRDFRETFGYPDDLPDLRRRPPHGPNPPGGNALQENTEYCCFARRERGHLPTICSPGVCPRFYAG
jgi:hypothetical protein